ncbi:hypothetical protein CLOP_g21210, partial [Closterium sp. NIES-67]
LMQDQGNGLQPITYLSKKLHGAELNYPIHDKEALAIIIAFKTWRCYLEGCKTTVYTDHWSLKYLKTQPSLSWRQVRWIDFLETHFHYDIVYKPGHKNKADALSRPAHTSSPSYQLPQAVMTQSSSSLTSSPKWDTSSRHTRQHAARRRHNSMFATSSHNMAFQPYSSPTETLSSPASSGRNRCLCSGPNSPCHPPTIRRHMDRPSASTKLWSNSSAQPARTTSPNGTCICPSWSLPTTMLLTPLLDRCRSSSATDATHSHLNSQTYQPQPVHHPTWKIHNAFHVQLLKPYRDPNTIFVGSQPPPPAPVLVQNEPEYEVESVLAHRHCRNGTVELLIRWKGYDPSEDSWVSESKMDHARRPLRDNLVK